MNLRRVEIGAEAGVTSVSHRRERREPGAMPPESEAFPFLSLSRVPLFLDVSFHFPGAFHLARSPLLGAVRILHAPSRFYWPVRASREINADAEMPAVRR